MPSAAQFKRGFGLADRGTQINARRITLILDKATVGHDTKEQYELYEFPFKFEFRVEGRLSRRDISAGEDEARRALHDFLRPPSRIIHSSYGSPYDCTLGKWDVRLEDGGKRCVMTGRGQAKRDRTLPTQAQEASSSLPSRLSGRRDATGEKAARALSKRYRVIRSHFSSGVCHRCQKHIPVGERIAQTEDGWCHVLCLRPASLSSSAASTARSRSSSPSSSPASSPRPPSGSSSSRTRKRKRQTTSRAAAPGEEEREGVQSRGERSSTTRPSQPRSSMRAKRQRR